MLGCPAESGQEAILMWMR